MDIRKTHIYADQVVFRSMKMKQALFDCNLNRLPETNIWRATGYARSLTFFEQLIKTLKFWQKEDKHEITVSRIKGNLIDETLTHDLNGNLINTKIIIIDQDIDGDEFYYHDDRTRTNLEQKNREIQSLNNELVTLQTSLSKGTSKTVLMNELNQTADLTKKIREATFSFSGDNK